MKNFKLILLNLITMLIFSTQAIYSQDTTITGKANNLKNGAVIVTTSGVIYFIDKLDLWDSNFLNKNVRVTGIVVNKKIKIKKTKVLNAHVSGPSIKVIKKPKIELLSDS